MNFDIAYLFDLDGTLMDSEMLWVRATQACLRDHGIVIEEEETMELVYGYSWADVYARALRCWPRLDVSLARMEREMREHFTTLRERVDPRIPSSVALLERLARDAPVAIVSGSPRADIANAVALLDIAKHLRFYLGSEDYSPGKPDPAGYRLAARRLALAPGRCVVFEDSTQGIRAAVAAGMRCVALLRFGHPPQDVSTADWVLEDLADFSLAELDRRSPPRL